MATNNPLNMIDDLLELKIGECLGHDGEIECLGYGDVDQGKVIVERVADNTTDYDLDDEEDGVPQFTVTIFEYDDEVDEDGEYVNEDPEKLVEGPMTAQEVVDMLGECEY